MDGAYAVHKDNRMKFRTEALDDQHVYPCSKRDVKDAFGEGLLEDVSFNRNPHVPDHPRYSPHIELSGSILMKLSVRPDHSELNKLLSKTSLYVYPAKRSEWDNSIQEAVQNLMGREMRTWLANHVGLPETAQFGRDELVVELDGGILRLHETRWR